MNDNNTNSRLSPNQVIIVYADSGRHHFYLESRDVKSISGKMTLMPAVPLTDQALRDVALAYVRDSGGEMDFDGIIPGHILYCSNKPGKLVVMWYRPAMKRSLNLSESLGFTGEVAVQVPATLYVVINDELYIYALMTSDRPERSTRIYRAPFFNVYSDGRVCLGTARVGKKADSFTAEAERFERGFYMAEQSHGQLEKCKTPLPELWKRLVAKPGPFPSKKELIQHSYKTVGGLLTELIGKH